jgi:aquaporin Z
MAIGVPNTRAFLAEFIGTFWLVFGGCGSAVLAAVFPYDNAANPLGLGFLGVSIAFGLTLLTAAYAIGHISGCHINPAVTFGFWSAGRFPGSQILTYVVAQVLGAIAAGGLIVAIASGRTGGFTLSGSNPLATNGWGSHSPGGYGFAAALLIELVLTFLFLLVILGSTDRLAPSGFAGLPIGLSLVLIHLISIPVTNTSVNPARSTGVALWAGTEAVGQLWLFWLAPIAGALLAGWVYRNLLAPDPTAG